eukprot:EG_transcript_7540
MKAQKDFSNLPYPMGSSQPAAEAATWRVLGWLRCHPGLINARTLSVDGLHLPHFDLSHRLSDILRKAASLQHLHLDLKDAALDLLSWHSMVNAMTALHLETLSLVLTSNVWLGCPPLLHPRHPLFQLGRSPHPHPPLPAPTQWIEALTVMRTLRSLTLGVANIGFAPQRPQEVAQSVVAAAQAMPGLHSLALEFGTGTDAGVIAALALLGAVPHLEVLSLALPKCRAPAGLAALQHTPSLRRLDLDLGGSCLGGEVQWLASLGAAVRLRKLRLGLAECGLDFAALQQLLTLCGSPGLEALQLDLCGNVVRSSATDGTLFPAQWSPSLRTLRLEFAPGTLDDGEVKRIAAFGCLVNLESLTLILPGCVATVGACLDLATLRHCPSLRQLTLELRGSRVGPGGAQALASLWSAPNLRELHLGLASCGLGLGGAQALAELKKSSSLRALLLDLAGNHIANPGAKALAALAETPRLVRLSLLLADNRLSGLGVDRLQRLRTGRLPALDLRLDLSCNPAVWNPSFPSSSTERPGVDPTW